MPVTHIVLFRFQDSVPAEKVVEASQRFIALKEGCVRPSTGKPYILATSGGIDNSPEGAQAGITHAFIAEFENEADRDYYVSKDPFHEQYKQFLVPLLAQGQVIDFTNGVFTK